MHEAMDDGACANSNMQEAEVGFCELHAGQGYIVRSCFVLFSYEGVQLSLLFFVLKHSSRELEDVRNIYTML